MEESGFRRGRRFRYPPGVTHFELFPDAHSTVVAKRFLQTIQAVLKNGRQETFETYSPSLTQSYLFEISDAGVDDHFFLLLRHVPDGSCDDRQMHQLLKEQAFLFQSECIGYWKSVSRVFS